MTTMLHSIYWLLFLFHFQNKNVLSYDNPTVLENIEAITSLVPFCQPILIFHGRTILYDQQFVQPAMLVSCIKYHESYYYFRKEYKIINNTCNLFTSTTRNHTMIEPETLFLSNYRRHGKSGGCHVFYLQSVRPTFQSVYPFTYKGMNGPSVYFVLLTIQKQYAVLNENDIWWIFGMHSPYHSIIFFVTLIDSKHELFTYLKVNQLYVQCNFLINFKQSLGLFSLSERKRLLLAEFDTNKGWIWQNVWLYRHSNITDLREFSSKVSSEN